MHRSYIASEANYRVLREAELNNAIVPLVGNFAGDKAIRAVAAYLKEHHATVTAFYLSNVEQYLWNGSDDGRKFFGNVAALPLDSTSTFIRAVFDGGGFRGGRRGRDARPHDPRLDAGPAQGVPRRPDQQLLRRDPALEAPRRAAQPRERRAQLSVATGA